MRRSGRNSRENAGISSESGVRNFTVENLRFPGEGLSTQGKSGPKMRLRKRSRWATGRNSCTAVTRLREAGTQGDRLSGQQEVSV